MLSFFPRSRPVRKSARSSVADFKPVLERLEDRLNLSDILIGSFGLNPLYNSAGLITERPYAPTDGNPYYKDQYSPQGNPYFLDAAPGSYYTVTTGYVGGEDWPGVYHGGASVWNGDASGGIRTDLGWNGDPPGGTSFGLVGTRVDFKHTYGQIVLYTWVWSTTDNNAPPITYVDLYKVSNPDTDIVPTSLSWDTTSGGMNFTYTVSGSTIASDVPVALYWASGPQWTDRIAPISGFSYSIPAGTNPQTTPYQQHVNGAILKNAPAGTTYLLVVTDPGNKLGNFDASKNVKALQDVSVTGYPASVYEVSARTLETIKGLLRESGQGDQVAVISRTVATPHSQAVAMYRNLRMGMGRNYKAPGLAVIAVYDALVAAGVTSQAKIVAAMEVEIIRQGAYNVSHHCADAAQWAALQVIDIDPKSIRNSAPDGLFHNAATRARGDGRLSDFHDPQDDDPAFHLEIPQ